MKHRIKFYALSIILIFIISCRKHGYKDRYGPFYIQNDTTVFMNGDMGIRVNKQFKNLLEDYPKIKLVIFGKCPGSRNDESMIEAAKLLKNRAINTHLSFTSIIESGAVDFFLAGNTRTKESGSIIGVHAWRDGKKSATDYPIGSEEHQLYIDYYIFCGYTTKDAEELYYFIINSASSDDIHYMSEEEVKKYQILKP